MDRSSSILVLAVLPLLAGCARGVEVHETADMMGTVFSVRVHIDRGGAKEEAAARSAIGEAFEEARKVEKGMSEYDPRSAVSQINALAGKSPVAVDDGTWAVIEEAVRGGQETGGAFDVTFAPLGRLWDYKAKNPHVPSPGEIGSALELVGPDKLVLDPSGKTVFLAKEGCRIGLGGIAKGYALDLMGAALEKRGYVNYIVYGGGDLLVSGRKGSRSWEIGIQHPRRTGALIARFGAEGKTAVATSGDYERFFILDGVRYHHILDTRTGMPSKGVLSATVIASTGMRADLLATACMILGPQKSKDLRGRLGDFAALLIDDTMAFHRIGPFPAVTMVGEP